jgi:hypothetical protein
MFADPAGGRSPYWRGGNILQPGHLVLDCLVPEFLLPDFLLPNRLVPDFLLPNYLIPNYLKFTIHPELTHDLS